MDLLTGKKVLLFAVPGAVTPDCTMADLPGYTVNADTNRRWGVDGNGELTAALGLELVGSGFGQGTRS